jgi:hypothetical protein
MSVTKLLANPSFRKALIEYLACLQMQVESDQDSEIQQKCDERTLELIVRLMQIIESQNPNLSANEVESTFKAAVDSLRDSPEVLALKSLPNFKC